jgi:hypothetical protein
MKSIRTAAIAAAFVLACGGCATLPQGTVTYYLAKTSVSVKVTRTVGCDANDQVIVANTVSSSTVHEADPHATHHLQLAKLRSVFADTDVKIDLTDDGRVKTLNGTLTGHGDEILNKVISIAGTVAVRGLGFRSAKAADACQYIRGTAGTDKVLTLTYEAPIDLQAASTHAQVLPPQMSSDVYDKRLLPALGKVCAYVTAVRTPHAPVAHTDRDAVILHARQPGIVEITIKAGHNIADGEDKAACGKEIATMTVVAAQKGVDYEIPLPKAPAFGKQVVAITFAESGALSSLQYATTSGTSSALGSLDSALTAASSLNSRRAEALNAEANLIAAQQRLVRCQADPSACQ